MSPSDISAVVTTATDINSQQDPTTTSVDTFGNWAQRHMPWVISAFMLLATMFAVWASYNSDLGSLKTNVNVLNSRVDKMSDKLDTTSSSATRSEQMIQDMHDYMLPSPGHKGAYGGTK